MGNDEFFEAYAEELIEDEGDSETIKALQKTITSEFEKYAKIKKNIPEEALASVAGAEDPRQLVDLIAGHLGIEVEEKQKLLENLIISDRLEQAYSHMQSEVSVLQVEKKIKTRVNSQMKAIQKELGDGEDGQNEIAELEARVKDTKLSKEAKEKAEAEIKKLKSMSPM